MESVVIDRTGLQSWIQPQHLEPARLFEYRQAFDIHPGRLVVLQDLLTAPVAERLARFLAAEGEFEPEFGIYSTEGKVSEEEWLKADEQDRFFRLGKLVRTPPQFQMSPNALTYLQFRRVFQRPEMKGLFEAISGLPLGWSDDFGAHAMRSGDFLRPHSDDNRNRRLALVIYLTPDWRREFGGELHVIDRNGHVTEIEPLYNSMIVFDVLAAPAHLVRPITAAAGAQQRLTIGGWYHRGD